MQARITIGLRPGVLDPEAQTIQRSLGGLGFTEVQGLRKLKVIEVELAMSDRSAAEARLREMCEKLLANPVIESYQIEVIER